ncbi:hypothetical protein OTB20_08290 [Streptomyces sp. H27-H1]|uniref:hypothetical protein n=1 Tax=Streptomyces sp. H27-H1 TaxID=2996461 RepID=UPI00227201D0|nr:hypothetical protein [Streptomyces sp. H27-H1]MCY0926203.1 hypothetical protein [Streptomyces sp. H27-H1]
MARTLVPVLTAARTGVAFTSTTGDATNNHYVVNSGSVVIIVENAGASARIVTFLVARKVDGLSVTPRTKSLPAGAKEIFGPFDPQEYGGKLLVDVAHADLKLTAIAI